MPKVHNHDDQLDGRLYARCGRVQADHPSIVTNDTFEAADPAWRCATCDRDWFPHGQPDWHLAAAKRRQAEAATTTTKDAAP